MLLALSMLVLLSWLPLPLLLPPLLLPSMLPASAHLLGVVGAPSGGSGTFLMLDRTTP